MLRSFLDVCGPNKRHLTQCCCVFCYVAAVRSSKIAPGQQETLRTNYQIRTKNAQIRTKNASRQRLLKYEYIKKQETQGAERVSGFVDKEELDSVSWPHMIGHTSRSSR